MDVATIQCSQDWTLAATTSSGFSEWMWATAYQRRTVGRFSDSGKEAEECSLRATIRISESLSARWEASVQPIIFIRRTQRLIPVAAESTTQSLQASRGPTIIPGVMATTSRFIRLCKTTTTNRERLRCFLPILTRGQSLFQQLAKGRGLWQKVEASIRARNST